MKIIAGIIGMGIGQKHLDAIDKYKGSIVKMICELDKKKIRFLKKKYPDKIITNNENNIFLDKSINLVSIASFDNYHYKQILKGIKNDKQLIVEKPLCLNIAQLKKIKNLLKNKPKINITSNLVLRVNSLFQEFKKKINNKKIYYIEGDYIWGRKKKLLGWRSQIKDYSLVLGAGIHVIDLIMWLTGLKPTSVYAIGNKKPTAGSKFKKNSLVIMLFEFPMNILVKITANGAAIHSHLHELKIFSKDQTLVNSDLGSYMYKNKKILKINAAYPDKSNRKRLIQAFLDNLMKRDKKKIITFKEQIDLMSVCFSAEKSIRLSKKIKIKYL
jgi:predicted dehydrogenase